MSRHTKVKKKRKKSSDSPKLILIKQILLGVVLLLLVAGMFYGLWYLTHRDSLNLNEVEVVGGETVSHVEIEDIVLGKLEGDYFRLIPRSFVLTYPKTEIITEIINLDRVKNVYLERSRRKLLVAFEEHRPVALWCKGVTSRDCLFVDKEGYAFAKAPWLEGAAFMRYSEPGRSPVLELSFSTREFIEESNTFVSTTYDVLGLNIIHIEVPADSEVTYHIAGGGLIKVSTDLSTQETLENLEAILNSPEFSHLEPGNFKYIDLRFGNKVFVNEEVEPVATSTATSTAEG